MCWEIKHNLPAGFSQGQYPNSKFSRVGGSDLSHVWWRDRAILPLPTFVSKFRCVASFWNYSASKSKIRPNFKIFDPCINIGRGSAKCLRQLDIIHIIQLNHQMQNELTVKDNTNLRTFKTRWNCDDVGTLWSYHSRHNYIILWRVLSRLIQILTNVNKTTS